MEKREFRFRDLEAPSAAKSSTTKSKSSGPSFAELIRESEESKPASTPKTRATTEKKKTAPVVEPVVETPVVESKTGLDVKQFDRIMGKLASIEKLIHVNQKAIETIPDVINTSPVTTSTDPAVPALPDGIEEYHSEIFEHVTYFLYKKKVIVYLEESNSYLLGSEEYLQTNLMGIMDQIDKYPDDFADLDQKYSDDFIQIYEAKILQMVKLMSEVMAVYDYDADSISEINDSVKNTTDSVIHSMSKMAVVDEDDDEEEEDVNPEELENPNEIDLDELEPIDEEEMEEESPSSLRQYAREIDQKIPNAAVEDILEHARQARRSRSVQLEYSPEE